MQVIYTITEFPSLATIYSIVNNTEQPGQIDIAVKPQGGTDHDQFMVSIEIEMIGIYNCRARGSFRRQDRHKREVSVNIAGKSQTPDLLPQSEKTSVEVEFYFADSSGILGVKANAA